jgi:hypothetical protein
LLRKVGLDMQETMSNNPALRPNIVAKLKNIEPVNGSPDTILRGIVNCMLINKYWNDCEM